VESLGKSVLTFDTAVQSRTKIVEKVGRMIFISRFQGHALRVAVAVDRPCLVVFVEGFVLVDVLEENKNGGVEQVAHTDAYVEPPEADRLIYPVGDDGTYSDDSHYNIMIDSLLIIVLLSTEL